MKILRWCLSPFNIKFNKTRKTLMLTMLNLLYQQRRIMTPGNAFKCISQSNSMFIMCTSPQVQHLITRGDTINFSGSLAARARCFEVGIVRFF